MTDLTKYWPLENEVTAVCGFQAEFLEEHILLLWQKIKI